jgi:hypothetical protein
VRALDPAGNVDPTPASYTWTIETNAPETTITGQPPSRTNNTSATFTFSSSKPGSTFQCSLDAVQAACTSPRTYTGLAAGAHTFQVRATDAAGNVDPTPASYTWIVDLTAPDTTIGSGPANPTSATSATFMFTSTEPGSSFECRLDGAAFSACSSSKAYSALSAGSHTFEVRATDLAGNTDATPASHTWTIDTTAPETTITSAPTDPTSETTATFGFTSDEAGAVFECSLDGAAFAPCTSPQTYTALGTGSHTFQVRAVDGAGNADASPATHAWTVI